jgi:hypothetical protein
VSWLTNSDDAAKNPRRALAFLFVAGLVFGAAFGYLRFGHSLVTAALLAAGCAVALVAVGLRKIRQPQAAARATSWSIVRHAAALGIATAIGFATGSVRAFVVVYALGLIAVVAFLLRR